MALTTPNEGKITKEIEHNTSKLPSTTYLAMAVTAMVASATLKCLCRHKDALFVGQWVAPFLLFGIYNKIVKIEGHD